MPKPKDELLQAQVGQRLRELREKARLSQAEVAEAVGVSPESVGRSERGLLLPSLPTLVRLADLYEVTLDEMVGRGRSRRGGDPRVATLGRLLARLDEAQTDAVLALVKVMAPARRS